MCIICAANIHDTQLFIERDLVPCPRLLNLSHTLELADDSRHSPGWGYVLHGRIDAQEHLHGMPGGGAAWVANEITCTDRPVVSDWSTVVL